MMKISAEKLDKIIDMYFEDLKIELKKISPNKKNS